MRSLSLDESGVPENRHALVEFGNALRIAPFVRPTLKRLEDCSMKFRNRDPLLTPTSPFRAFPALGDNGRIVGCATRVIPPCTALDDHTREPDVGPTNPPSRGVTFVELIFAMNSWHINLHPHCWGNPINKQLV